MPVTSRVTAEAASAKEWLVSIIVYFKRAEFCPNEIGVVAVVFAQIL